MTDKEIIQTLIESKEDSLCLVCGMKTTSALKELVKCLEKMKISHLFKVNYKQRTLQYICTGCTLYLTTNSIGFRNVI